MGTVGEEMTMTRDDLIKKINEHRHNITKLQAHLGDRSVKLSDFRNSSRGLPQNQDTDLETGSKALIIELKETANVLQPLNDEMQDLFKELRAQVFVIKALEQRLRELDLINEMVPQDEFENNQQELTFTEETEQCNTVSERKDCHNNEIDKEILQGKNQSAISNREFQPVLPADQSLVSPTEEKTKTKIETKKEYPQDDPPVTEEANQTELKMCHTDKLRDMQQSIDGLHDLVAMHENEAKELKHKLDDTNHNYTLSLHELDEARTQLALKSKAFDELKNNNLALESELHASKVQLQQLSAASSELDTKKAYIDQMERLLSSEQKRANSLHQDKLKQIAHIEQQLSAERQASSEAMAHSRKIEQNQCDLFVKIEGLQEKVAKLREEKMQAELDIKAREGVLTAALNDAKLAGQNKDHEILQLKSSLRLARSERDKEDTLYNQAITKMQKEMDCLHHKLSSSLQLLEVATTECSDYKKKFEELEEVVAKKKSEAEASMKLIEDYRQQKSNLTVKSDNLEIELYSIQSEKETLNSELAELEDRIEELESDLTNESSMRRSAEETVRELETLVTTLEFHNNSLEEALETSQEVAKSLRLKLICSGMHRKALIKEIDQRSKEICELELIAYESSKLDDLWSLFGDMTVFQWLFELFC